MPTSPPIRAISNETDILARVLGNDEGVLTLSMARHILNREFSEADKTRMHDLARRNQMGTLSDDESNELTAYVKAGTLLSILKSKARSVVRGKSKRRTAS